MRHGLKLPDVFYVYDKKTIELLRPYYNNTEFILGCSGRFVSLKKEGKIERRGEYCLFVGGLSWFNNEILVNAMCSLLSEDAPGIKIKIRLHPFLRIRRQMKRMILYWKSRGKIELADKPTLKEDLIDSDVVVGVSSTVLEEALLFGRPVVKLTHPDYLEYISFNGVRGVTVIPYDELRADVVAKASQDYVDSDAILDRLGLGNRVVTYDVLFKN
jgi:hypothetical protein